MCLLIVLVTLVLTSWNILPEYSKIVISSLLGTMGISGFWINMFLRKFWMHLSINFCTYGFFSKIFLSLLISWRNFKKSEDKLKQQFNKGCTKQNIHKWNKIDEISVYPTKQIFFKNTSNKLIVYSKYFNIKKGKEPAYFSLNSKFHVLVFFINMFKKKMCSQLLSW